MTSERAQSDAANRTLFEVTLVPTPTSPPEGAESGGFEPLAENDDRQLLLFSDLAVLRREVEHAVMAGDFADARRLRRVALESFGSTGLAEEFAFVEALGPERWEQPPRAALAAWQQVDGRLSASPALRLAVRDGVFGRLLEHHDAAAIAREAPDVVGPLVAALTSLGEGGGLAAARALVRDLLLDGRELQPEDFTHDTALADLLGEHWPAAWLACLGALRRLWPAPPVDAAAMAAFRDRAFVPPSSETEAAQDFWRCLRLARTADVPEGVLHEARRRMKTLNPEMHALHMRAAATRSSSAGQWAPELA